MSAERFLDTNVFIYQLDRSDPDKSAIADKLIRGAVLNGNGCVSYQVVQECINVISRKARLPLSPGDTASYLDNVLAPLLRVGASVELYRHALSLQTRYQYSFYDSLIIAGAIEAGCSELISEDLQAGQQIGTLTIRNPFA
ncbi:MAG: PIN domain-containing protein [Burkholderiaceae bacterium]